MAKRKTSEDRETLLDNLRSGMSLGAACAQAGISRHTYYYWLKKSGEDGEWTRDVDAALTLSEPVLISQIKAHASTDWRAAAWLLSRRFPEHWGDRRSVDLNVQRDQTVTGDDVVKGMIDQLRDQLNEGADDERADD